MTLPEGERRNRIVNSALRQAVDGYGAVRIRQVADAAGVSVSSVYHYFPSKAALLLECLHRWLDEFADTEVVAIGGATDPHRRLLRVIESLTERLSLTPRLADTVARPYLNATGTAAKTAELVRDTLIQIFVDALRCDQAASVSHSRQVAELVADVWLANLLAIAQNRTTVVDLRQRLEHALSTISKNAGRQSPGLTATHSARGA